MAPPLAMEETAYGEGRERWPDVPLSLDRFCQHVRRLEVDEARLTVRAADLYLAAAVLERDARATSHFDREYLLIASEVVGRIDSSADFRAEVQQQMRVRLLTGDHPRLADYNASGGLLEWLRVVGLRVALNIKRSERRLVADEHPELRLLDGTDVERDALRGRYLEDLSRALERSFRQLEPRERTLLRLHFVDGLNIDAIGSMYGAHRATVGRWLVTIRRRIFDLARADVARTHRLDSQALRSIYRVLEKDLHITVARVLKSEVAAAPVATGK